VRLGGQNVPQLNDQPLDARPHQGPTREGGKGGREGGREELFVVVVNGIE